MAYTMVNLVDLSPLPAEIAAWGQPCTGLGHDVTQEREGR